MLEYLGKMPQPHDVLEKSREIALILKTSGSVIQP
jgi:hypothetical protein